MKRCFLRHFITYCVISKVKTALLLLDCFVIIFIAWWPVMFLFIAWCAVMFLFISWYPVIFLLIAWCPVMFLLIAWLPVMFLLIATTRTACFQNTRMKKWRMRCPNSSRNLTHEFKCSAFLLWLIIIYVLVSFRCSISTDQLNGKEQR